MNLYMKQKVFSWGDKFQVWDDAHTPRYSAQGEVFTWGKKLHVLDETGAELAFIRQKVWSFLPRFFIEIGGETVCEVVKEFSFMRPKYRIEGLNWRIEGEPWAHEYRVLNAEGRAVMEMSKAWFTWGDSYELRILDDRHELICLALALTVDAALAAEAQAANT